MLLQDQFGITQNFQTFPILQTSFLVGTFFDASYSKTVLDGISFSVRTNPFCALIKNGSNFFLHIFYKNRANKNWSQIQKTKHVGKAKIVQNTVLNMNWTLVGDTRKGWVYIFDQCGQTLDWMPNLKFKSKTDFTLNFQHELWKKLHNRFLSVVVLFVQESL